MPRSLAQLVARPLAACVARCRGVLDGLARAGRRGLGACAASSAPASDAFVRLARAIRLIAYLDMRLGKLLVPGAAARAANAVEAQAALVETPLDRPPHGQRLEEVEDLEDAEDLEEREDLVDREDLFDRERPDRFPRHGLGPARENDARALVEIVADICRDLGLDPEATEHAKAPFVELETLLAGPVLRSLGEGGEAPPEPRPEPGPRPPDRPRNRRERRAAAARRAASVRSRRRPP